MPSRRTSQRRTTELQAKIKPACYERRVLWGAFIYSFSQCIGNADLVKRELERSGRGKAGLHGWLKYIPAVVSSQGLCLAGARGAVSSPCPLPFSLPSEARGCGGRSSRGTPALAICHPVCDQGGELSIVTEIIVTTERKK